MSATVEPADLVELVVDGQPLHAQRGTSVAAALLASGRRSWRTTPSGAQRGLFCGIGVCFDCTATVDGAASTRTCVTTVADGMTVETGRPPMSERGPCGSPDGRERET